MFVVFLEREAKESKSKSETRLFICSRLSCGRSVFSIHKEKRTEIKDIFREEYLHGNLMDNPN